MFTKKTHVDIKKLTLKIQDSKKDTASRLRHLKTISGNKMNVFHIAKMVYLRTIENFNSRIIMMHVWMVKFGYVRRTKWVDSQVFDITISNVFRFCRVFNRDYDSESFRICVITVFSSHFFSSFCLVICIRILFNCVVFVRLTGMQIISYYYFCGEKRRISTV